MNGYQRNGNPESSRWKTNADEFRGYVRAKLEDLDEMQKEQWKEHYTTRKRIGKVEKRQYYINGGLAAINVVIIIFLAARGVGLI